MNILEFTAVQTVGEEYISILPLVSVQQRKVPRFTRRLIFIFLFTVAPFLAEKILERIKTNLETSLIASETRHLDRKQRNLRKTLLSLVFSIRLPVQDQSFVVIFIVQIKKISCIIYS